MTSRTEDENKNELLKAQVHSKNLFLFMLGMSCEAILATEGQELPIFCSGNDFSIQASVYLMLACKLSLILLRKGEKSPGKISHMIHFAH